MQSHRVPHGHYLAGQRGALGDLLADQEEGRLGVVLGEDLEHFGGALGVRPVVEGDGHERLRRRCPLPGGRDQFPAAWPQRRPAP